MFEGVVAVLAVTAFIMGMIYIPYALYVLIFLPVRHPRNIALNKFIRGEKFSPFL